jgi:PCI domain
MQFLSDRYFAQHAQYLVKELRILAYTQFLDAYKSVVLSSMAAVFGVTVPFMDAELSRFIAAGRLNAQIDKVRCTLYYITQSSMPQRVSRQKHACTVALRGKLMRELLYCVLDW